MCGICGFAGEGSQQDLLRMNAVMRHRGPDDDGVFIDHTHNVYFGHRRLSIIDLDSGQQPMATGDGNLVVTFNGEIYNHSGLRKNLEALGHVFTSDHSDTEVLLHGYREWGRRLPEKLNGMWAFAVFDRLRKKIFISRDRFGKKPLFYTRRRRTFGFASEINALAEHSHIATSISELSLKKYFAYGYIPAPHSIFKDIHKLPAGCNLLLNVVDLDFEVRTYWDFQIEPFDRIPKNPEETWGRQIRTLLSNAVKRRLMADVPLGIFLSGGIDSSSIAAFAVMMSANRQIETFSIGFGEAGFDESVFSNKVADLLGTKHCLEILSLNAGKDLLPEIISKLDEPMGDSSLLPTYLLSKVTRQNVKVALGGDGADELFAGYDPFRALRLAELYHHIFPKPVHQGIRMLIARLPVSHSNMSLDFRLKRTLRGLSYPKHLWNAVWLGTLSPKELNEIFHEPIDIELVYSEAILQWENCRQRNLVDKTLQFYTKLYLQDDILVKVDRAGMMNSLEVRAPYLDMELVDFVRRIPHCYKYRNGQTKYILKKALAPILPPEILYRSKKGFGIPIGQWLRSGEFEFHFNPSHPAFNMGKVKQKFHDHLNGYEDQRAFLWNYWLFNQWCRSGTKSFS